MAAAEAPDVRQADVGAIRTIAVALWSWRDTDGRRYRAHHGELVDLTGIDPADLERAHRLDVFEPEDEPTAPPPKKSRGGPSTT